MSKGTKKLVGVVVGVFVLFYMITQPQASAGIVRDLLSMLQQGAEALITFLQSLFA